MERDAGGAAEKGENTAVADLQRGRIISANERTIAAVMIGDHMVHIRGDDIAIAAAFEGFRQRFADPRQIGVDKSQTEEIDRPCHGIVCQCHHSIPPFRSIAWTDRPER